MDSSTGRRAYGLGSFFKSIGKAAKKIIKSPIGRGALMAGIGFGIPGTSFGGLFGRGAGSMFGQASGMLPTSWKNKLLMKQLTKKTATDAATYGGLDWGKAAIWGSTLLPWMLPGPEEDNEGDKGSNYNVLRDKYADEIMRIKAGVSAGSLNPNQWSYLPSNYTYTGAEGGRAGYYAGGQSIPSENTIEDARKTAMQDRLGGITDVMKRADLYRQGDVGQMYAANGGRIRYDAGGQTGHPPITMGQIQAPPQMPPQAPQPNPMPAPQPNQMAMMGGMNPMMAKGMNPMMAKGMNPMGGGMPRGMPRRMAQEGGLMDLGGMEKDYRNDGGFVPLGGEEKADDVPARLSKNEFVFTADAVRGAGGGDIDKGAEIMENIMKNLEQGGQISEETQGLTGAREMFDVSERLSEVV
jgi:hypothetical protein